MHTTALMLAAAVAGCGTLTIETLPRPLAEPTHFERAPRAADGAIEELRCAVGEQVSEGARLVEFKAET